MELGIVFLNATRSVVLQTHTCDLNTLRSTVAKDTSRAHRHVHWSAAADDPASTANVPVKATLANTVLSLLMVWDSTKQL